MSWQDRPYAHPRSRGSFGGGGVFGHRVGLHFPRPGHVVKWLLILNLGAFLVQILGDEAGDGVVTRVFAANAADWWQLWRYLTFQFLHDGPMHLGFNMLALYVLGTPVEGRMGSKGLLRFYLFCGAMAGVAYVVLSVLLNASMSSPLVGASGGVYAIVVAAAFYLPDMRLRVIVIPMRMRTLAIIVLGFMVLGLLGGLVGVGDPRKFWSAVAHSGGAAAGAAWILASRRRGRGPTISEKIKKGRWDRKMAEQQKARQEVDRILEKIHHNGIASLTGKEKRLLQKATEQQRDEDNRIKRL